MTVELNHIVIPARDKRAAAEFLAGVLGMETAPEWGPFPPVRVANGVTIDFTDATNAADFGRHHYAFLVSEAEFDAILRRLEKAGIPYSADRGGRGRGEINQLVGGRSFSFLDPDGHRVEVLTQSSRHDCG